MRLFNFGLLAVAFAETANHHHHNSRHKQKHSHKGNLEHARVDASGQVTVVSLAELGRPGHIKSPFKTNDFAHGNKNKPEFGVTTTTPLGTADITGTSLLDHGEKSAETRKMLFDPAFLENVLTSDWVIGCMISIFANFLSVAGMTLMKKSHHVDVASAAPSPKITRGGVTVTVTSPRASSDAWYNEYLTKDKVMWIMGFVVYLVSQPLNAIALVFSPMALLAPLCIFDVLFNMMFAAFFLREPFTTMDIAMTISAALFALGVIILGPHVQEKDFTGKSIYSFWRSPWRTIVTIASLATIAIGIYAVQQTLQRKHEEEHGAQYQYDHDAEPVAEREPEHEEDTHLDADDDIGRPKVELTIFETMAFPVTAALCSAWSQMFIKCIGIQLRGGIPAGDEGEFCLSVILMCSCAWTSLWLITKAISLLDNRFFVPVLFSITTVSMEIMGIVFLSELSNMRVWRASLFFACCGGCLLSAAQVNHIATTEEFVEESKPIQRAISGETDATPTTIAGTARTTSFRQSSQSSMGPTPSYLTRPMGIMSSKVHPSSGADSPEPMVAVVPIEHDEHDEHDNTKADRSTAHSSQGRSTLSRRTSIISAAEHLVEVLFEFRYDDPAWLFFPFIWAVCLCGLCVMLVVCQGLEAKPQGILMRDPEQTAENIWNPETVLACYASVQPACIPYYGAAVYFGGCCLFCMLEIWFIGQTAKRFDDLDKRSNSFIGDRKWEKKVQTFLAYVTPINTPFAPGEKWFWYRAWISTTTEIGLQIMRAWVIQDAYARVSAAQTLAQTVLLIMHVDVFLLMYYKRSEVGYVSTGFCFEVAYLAVRIWLYGPLSLRILGFWDFLTIASPLLICISDIHEMIHFITHGTAIEQRLSAQTAASDGLNYNSSAKRNKWKLVTSALLFTVSGVVLCGAIIQTGWMQECPSVTGTHTDTDAYNRPANYFIPKGADCYSWQYNFFLDPPCSCLYLSLNPAYGEHCAGMGDNDGEALQQMIPHLDDLRFLTIAEGMSEICSINENNLELVSTFTRLQGIQIADFYFDAMPKSFAKLKDMRNFDIWFSRIKSIDLEVVEMWPRLETWTCSMCPFMDNFNGLARAKLPRLKFVEAHGVQQCPLRQDFQGVELHCTSRDAEESCPGMPEWMFASYIGNARVSKERDTCVASLCESQATYILNLDGNKDFLWSGPELNFQNRLRVEWITNTTVAASGLDYTEDTHRCVVQAIRDELGIEHHHYIRNMMMDYLSLTEFLAVQTQYTSCGSCAIVQEAREEQLRLAEERTAIDANDPCAVLYQNSNMKPDEAQAACSDTGTECIANTCPVGLQLLMPTDKDYDMIYNESAFSEAFGSLGMAWAQAGIFDCFAAHAPACLNAVFEGKPATSFQSLQRLGQMANGWMPLTSCESCDYYPVPGEKSVYHDIR